MEDMWPARLRRLKEEQKDAKEQSTPSAESQAGSIEEQANVQQQGLTSEFLGFLRHNKKWFLLPIITVLLLVTAIVMVGGSAVAPFIHTLF